MFAAADPLGEPYKLSAPPRAGDEWQAFVRAIEDLRDSQWPADIERARFWYDPLPDRVYEDAEIRRTDLIQLQPIAAGYCTRERFLTELTLDPPDATSDQAGVPLLNEDYLIHSAKGQEWKSVYVLNAVDGCMPSDLGAGTTAELEEERRLLHVTMTRAGRSPFDRPAAFLHPWSKCQGRPSPLRITNALHTELTTADVRAHKLARAGADAERQSRSGPRVDIGAGVRGMWT